MGIAYFLLFYLRQDDFYFTFTVLYFREICHLSLWHLYVYSMSTCDIISTTIFSATSKPKKKPTFLGDIFSDSSTWLIDNTDDLKIANVKNKNDRFFFFFFF